MSEEDSKSHTEDAASEGTLPGIVGFFKTRAGMAVLALAFVVLIGAGIALAMRSGDTPNGSPSSLESTGATDTAGADTTTTPGTATGTDPAQMADNPDGTPPNGLVTPPPGGPQNQPIAKQGSELTTLTAPPPKTLGLLKLPEGFESAVFEMTFSPYGWGPGGPTSGHLVAKIEKSVGRSGQTDEFRDMTGVNASLWTSPMAAEVIEAGGTYVGTVEVRARGDVGALFLTDVKPGK
ncbi:MAG: hypothetical protein U1E22_01905 [Coriobacteriia bacterium]|nr:hypothetical protein [Coriobacteriia bacterium]